MAYPDYVSPTTIDPSNPVDGLNRLAAMAADPSKNDVAVQAYLTDMTGKLLTDLSGDLVKTSDSKLDYTCNSNVPASLSLSTRSSLRWGSDLVAVFQLIRNQHYNEQSGIDPDTYFRYPLGQYIVTTPGYGDLDVVDFRQVTGYGKNYLLQNGLDNSYSYAGGSACIDAVTQMFQSAGVLAVGAPLSSVCDYPGDWPAKVFQSPQAWALSDNTNFLAVVNDILKATGCRQLSVQTSGRWMIEYISVGANQTDRWGWYGSGGTGITDGQLDSRVVLRHNTGYAGDVWNVPNQWVGLVQGADYVPDEGNGRKTIDNKTFPPSDQVTIGRVIRTTLTYTASSQADLEAQLTQDVNNALSAVEQLSLQTTAWPAASHYDVFTFHHTGLPLSAQRKVQAQKWSLPLFGGPMSWNTNVAVSL